MADFDPLPPLSFWESCRSTLELCVEAVKTWTFVTANPKLATVRIAVRPTYLSGLSARRQAANWEMSQLGGAATKPSRSSYLRQTAMLMSEPLGQLPAPKWTDLSARIARVARRLHWPTPGVAPVQPVRELQDA